MMLTGNAVGYIAFLWCGIIHTQTLGSAGANGGSDLQRTPTTVIYLRYVGPRCPLTSYNWFAKDKDAGVKDIVQGPRIKAQQLG